jgi:alkanesulfonate monooxygenase SsuD/methylene tetrahydromethanopterin reductase-like flavin-dependent oxidoreductase (luciferase family)
MKLSVSVANYSWPHSIRDRLATLAGVLDETAVDTLWVPDHLLQADPASGLDEPMLEAYTALGHLAARHGSASAPWSPPLPSAPPPC